MSTGDTLAQVYFVYTKPAAQTVFNPRNGTKAMSNEPSSQPDIPQPMLYQIRIKGHLDSQWTDWFEGLTITLEEDGDTLLTGRLVDQAALHGLLKKIRDLGMPLVAVCPLEHCPAISPRTGQADRSDGNSK